MLLAAPRTWSVRYTDNFDPTSVVTIVIEAKNMTVKIVQCWNVLTWYIDGEKQVPGCLDEDGWNGPRSRFVEELYTKCEDAQCEEYMNSEPDPMGEPGDYR